MLNPQRLRQFCAAIFVACLVLTTHGCDSCQSEDDAAEASAEQGEEQAGENAAKTNKKRAGAPPEADAEEALKGAESPERDEKGERVRSRREERAKAREARRERRERRKNGEVEGTPPNKPSENAAGAEKDNAAPENAPSVARAGERVKRSPPGGVQKLDAAAMDKGANVKPDTPEAGEGVAPAEGGSPAVAEKKEEKAVAEDAPSPAGTAPEPAKPKTETPGEAAGAPEPPAPDSRDKRDSSPNPDGDKAEAEEQPEEALDPVEQRRLKREKRLAELRERREQRLKELGALGATAPVPETPAPPTPGRASEGGTAAPNEASSGVRADATSPNGRGGAGSPQPEGTSIREQRDVAPRGVLPEPGKERPSRDVDRAEGNRGDSRNPRPKPSPPPRPAIGNAGGGPVLPIDAYLRVDDILQLTGKKNISPMGPLKGIPVGASHNSISFGMGGPDQLAVALQVWQESTRIDANERYEAMRAQYPNAEDTTGLTAKTLFSYWNDLMTLTFLDFTRRMVISVTCNQSVCSQKQLLELTKLVQSRM